MQARLRVLFVGAVSVVLALSACSDDEKKQSTNGECDLSAPECSEGQACEAMADGTGRCFSPVVVKGIVRDALSEEPIAEALVQAMDANESPLGAAVRTNEEGAYELKVPAARDEEGTPQQGGFTLRAAAKAYEPFPTPMRPSLPLDLGSASEDGNGWVIENTATELRLLPLKGDPSSLGSIAGKVTGEKVGGVLVVAEGGEGAHTGMSDDAGTYVIFNLPAGSFTVNGYAKDVQFAAVAVTLTAGEDKTGVDLTAQDTGPELSTVSGTVQIVNAPGGSTTSVVLALESTFVESVARGTVPPGLRAAGVTSAFEISGVPAGRYVVLAAFENDGLVRDPDQTIGGTDIVRIEVPDPTAGANLALPEGFKVTGALAVISPGAEQPEAVPTATPDFVFADDSSEDGYLVKVFDAYGEEIWQQEFPGSSGDSEVTATYAGPALEEGNYYQFRAFSFREKQGRTYISATEDLRGVFYFEP